MSAVDDTVVAQFEIMLGFAEPGAHVDFSMPEAAQDRFYLSLILLEGKNSV
jgi:hypothetical protein